MSCFEKLTKSRFLSNVGSELLEAQHVLHETDELILPKDATHIFDKEKAKDIYYYVCNEIGFFDELYTMDLDYKGTCYAQADKYLFIFSRSKVSITDDIGFNNRVNGDIPIFTHKHVVNGKVVYTALIDVTFTIPPPSPN